MKKKREGGGGTGGEGELRIIMDLKVINYKINSQENKPTYISS